MESIGALRARCQTVHTDDFSAQIVRRVSIYFTWLLIPTGISANGVSMVNVAVGVLAGVSFAAGALADYALAGYAIGAILFATNAILDGVDGEIARYRRQSSLTGLYADRINSIFVYPFLIFGTAAGLYWQYNVVEILFVGFVAAWGFNALRLVKTNMDSTVIDGLTLSKARREDAVSTNPTEAVYQPFSEYLRAKNKVLLTALDFMLIRQPGIVIVFGLAVVAEATIAITYGNESIVMAPLFYVALGYALVTLAAIPAAIYVTLSQKRVERVFAHVKNRMAQDE